MAFMKYARAEIQKPGISFSEWDSLRRGAVSPAPDFQKRTAKVILQEYDPSRYMLSHATIVASVDVANSAAPMGRQFVEGFEVNRKWSDYYITPDTSRYINNNNDAFERKLLLAAFKTFVGAQSYVEHIQVPELSKGRIIDAAARDIGDSVYIDILIANDLKHAPLIRAIKSGKLGTLSMGCSTSSTTCTKCGNVAEDETHLCPCIRYFKGSEFRDENGIVRKVAELCGHFTDPTSVKFIEASWVANPAFKGAVIRNILTSEELGNFGSKMMTAFSMPTPQADPNHMVRAARYMWAEDEFSDDFNSEEEPETEQVQEDPLQKAVSDLTSVIREQAVKQVRDEINRNEINEVRDSDPNKQNESLIKSAMKNPEWQKIGKIVISFVGQPQSKRALLGLLLYKQGGWKKLGEAGFTGKEILGVSRLIDVMTKKSSIAGENRVYRTVLNVGGFGPYRDVERYLAACRQDLGRVVTGSEAAMLIQKGKLYALGRS